MLDIFIFAVPSAPCDIYGAAGSPCVAAHSTVRALFDDYNGPLYEVKRADGMVMKIMAVGGWADVSALDTFCRLSTNCTIDRIFDQSRQSNHLGLAPAGGAHRAPDRGANATAAVVTVGGHRAYGVFVEHGTGPGRAHSGVGYRNDTTSGVARGDAAETMLMVVSGRRHNGGWYA